MFRISYMMNGPMTDLHKTFAILTVKSTATYVTNDHSENSIRISFRTIKIKVANKLAAEYLLDLERKQFSSFYIHIRQLHSLWCIRLSHGLLAHVFHSKCSNWMQTLRIGKLILISCLLNGIGTYNKIQYASMSKMPSCMYKLNRIAPRKLARI